MSSYNNNNNSKSLSNICILKLFFLQLNGNQHPNITGNVTVAPPSNLGGRHHSGEYDGGMACTSIVAQNVNGEVYHGRNLDWNLPNELRNLTVQVRKLSESVLE